MTARPIVIVVLPPQSVTGPGYARKPNPTVGEAVKRGAHLDLKSAAFGGLPLLFLIGSVLGFVSWLLGLMYTARGRQWDWFLAILLLGPLTALIYCRCGREAQAPV